MPTSPACLLIDSVRLQLPLPTITSKKFPTKKIYQLMIYLFRQEKQDVLL